MPDAADTAVPALLDDLEAEQHALLDLVRAIGLATISHVAPSALDVMTFRRLSALLPATFVAGIGVELPPDGT